MTMLFRRWPSHVVVGSLLVLPVTQVQASGYHFGSQSVAAQGSAHANGAEAADPSTISTTRPAWHGSRAPRSPPD